MSPKKQIHPDIVTASSQRHGVFANAFRVLPDGGEFLLDFLVYSQVENSAKVVSRIRVNPSVLAAIKDRLGSFLGGGDGEESPGPMFVARGNEEVH